MKKQLIKLSISIFAILLLCFTFCKKKKEEAPPPPPSDTTTTAITPTYVVTTSTVPVTVTGSSTLTNPATQNSALNVSGPGWTYAACASYPMKLVGYNGSTQVEIIFGGATMLSQTYSFTSGIPNAGQARMVIWNAPGQPEGIVWYSQSGMVSVSTGTTGTTATFVNIQCLQQQFSTPVVSVSGTLTCF